MEKDLDSMIDSTSHALWAEGYWSMDDFNDQDEDINLKVPQINHALEQIKLETEQLAEMQSLNESCDGTDDVALIMNWQFDALNMIEDQITDMYLRIDQQSWEFKQL